VLVAPDDADTLGREVLALLSDRERASRMGAEAAANVRARFAMDTMVRRIEAVYDDVLAGRALATAPPA
jgi:glycosyltransferase involved in cell wall biosynthesis